MDKRLHRNYLGHQSLSRVISVVLFRLRLSLILSLILSFSLAQKQEVRFTQIPESNGISIGKINGMTRDKYGFLWLSDQTFQSILRYDGTNLIRYQYDAENPEGLGGYYPECMASDSTGAIWIGFYGMGLDHFDPVSNTFTHFRHDPADPGSLSNDFVSAVLVDHLGNLWIGTNAGVDLFQSESGTFRHFRHDPEDLTSLSSGDVRAIYEDKQGTLWVGTGFALNLQDDGGMSRFDRATGTFTRFEHDPDDPQSLFNSKIRAMFEDSNGNFWVGSGKNGLHLMDREAGTFQRFVFDSAFPDRLAAPPITHAGSHITFIAEDPEHHLWFGTNNEGLNRYDPRTESITHYGKGAGTTEIFPDNSGWWINVSDDGLLWMSTQEANLYKIDIYSNTIPKFERFGGVNGFFQESPTILWMGTNNGLVREDRESGDIRRFVHDPQDSSSLSNNFVNTLQKDSRGNFWVGTSNGLNLLDPSHSEFSRFIDSNLNVADILQDRDSVIWIGARGGGLIRVDPETEEIFRFPTDEENPTMLPNRGVLCLEEDEDGHIWVGLARNGGLHKLDKTSGKITRFLEGYYINDVYSDPSGRLWAGTPNGLFLLDEAGQEFRPTSVQTAVRAIIADDLGDLFVTTSSGIFKINPETQQFVLFGKSNGVIGDNFMGGGTQSESHKLPDGRILFATITGYYAINPSELVSLPIESRVYFTDLWIDGKPVVPGAYQPISKSMFETLEIRLTHDQNIFSLGVSEVDFRNTGENLIFYQLLGYDTDWRRSIPGERLSYFNVPPGRYTLKARAANSINGQWTEKGVSVIIAPPWWNTWWAYILYTIVFCIGVYGVHTFQKRRVIREERERTRERELQQAKEIEKAYNELKTTQQQLIHSEKMASLGELTAGIAHEIQNPLNFVNNFSDVNMELVQELKEEINQGNTEEAKAIADDIETNEQKIVHHGKRAEEIVRSMLQHSRGTEGKKEPTDLNVLADEFLRLAYHGMRAKDKSFNVTMETEFDANLSQVKVVSQDIGRVILNLITNAFFAVTEKAKKGIDGFQPTVWVSTRLNGNMVEIQVKDNGSGIPDRIKDKIFQPFFSTKGTGQGTGLGLSLSYDIITKGHGGSIDVDSTEGEGTQFKMCIPA